MWRPVDVGEFFVGELVAPLGVEVADPAGPLVARSDRRPVLELGLLVASRRPLVAGSELVGELRVGVEHLSAARRPALGHRGWHPGDLSHRDTFVGVRGDPFDAGSVRQFAFERRSVEGAGCVDVSVDRSGVEGPPHAVVSANPVEDRAVGVELRVADALARRRRACRPVSQSRNDEACRLCSLKAASAGSGVARGGLEVVESCRDGGIVCGDDSFAHALGGMRGPQR